jgi:DNA-binding CsgD family transcriptional regulator
MPAPLLELLDSLSEGVLVLDSATGAVVHRNRALGVLLEAEPDSSMLYDAVLQLGQRWRRLALAPRAEHDGRALLSDARFVANRAAYRLWGMALQLGGSLPVRVLVLVERTGPLLPTVSRLRSRFRLTTREAEVALLLAEGASDADIGRILGMSVHTARHHGERIFTKVGVHSRKALALHLA